MLSKDKRISSFFFKKIFTTGKRVFSSHFRLQYFPTEHFQCAVVIPKKIYPKRVERNRHKRIILEHIKKTFPSPPQVACIFSLQKNINEVSSHELSRELTDLILKNIKNQDRK